ncbi:MAG: hypothetical protein JWM76_364 [Pseudonocardiales bacterium]|nr:hypothetical protein [Pseudonocardiales bacterium]
MSRTAREGLKDKGVAGRPCVLAPGYPATTARQVALANYTCC